MKTLLLASVALVVSSAFAVADETAFKATLVSQAILPANTVISAPADAPAFLKQAGKFSTPDRKRATTLGSVPGLDGVRKTGLGLPFDGQAVQGFSGIKTMADGSFWTLSDIDHATGGPARYVRVAETGGRLGFITPLSHNFCETCNRVRLTCTGTLHTCLGREDASDLRAVIRDGADDAGLVDAIRLAIDAKPQGHDFQIARAAAPAVARHMSTTGG